MGSLSVVSRQVLRTDTRGTRVCVSVGTLVYCVYCTLLHCNTRGQSSGSCFQTSTENWRMRNSHICLALHVTQYLMPTHYTLAHAQYVCTYMPHICLALHVTQQPKERVHTSYASGLGFRYAKYVSECTYTRRSGLQRRATWDPSLLRYLSFTTNLI